MENNRDLHASLLLLNKAKLRYINHYGMNTHPTDIICHLDQYVHKSSNDDLKVLHMSTVSYSYARDHI